MASELRQQHLCSVIRLISGPECMQGSRIYQDLWPGDRRSSAHVCSRLRPRSVFTVCYPTSSHLLSGRFKPNYYYLASFQSQQASMGPSWPLVGYILSVSPPTLVFSYRTYTLVCPVLALHHDSHLLLQRTSTLACSPLPSHPSLLYDERMKLHPRWSAILFAWSHHSIAACTSAAETSSLGVSSLKRQYHSYYSPTITQLDWWKGHQGAHRSHHSERTV